MLSFGCKEHGFREEKVSLNPFFIRSMVRTIVTKENIEDVKS